MTNIEKMVAAVRGGREALEPWAALVVNSCAIALSVMAGASAWEASVEKKRQSYGAFLRVILTFVTAFIGALLPYAAMYILTGYLPMGKRT